EVERFCDAEIQELVRLVQEDENDYAKMRITKLLEPVINKCYRKCEAGICNVEDFFMAAVILLHEYIYSYVKKGDADFCYLLKKRLVGLNAKLRDERNVFHHGMGQYMARIRRFVNEFEGIYGVPPSKEAISEELGLSMVSVEHCLWVIRANEAVSLDGPVSKDADRYASDKDHLCLKDTIPDPNTEMDYVESHRRELIIEEVKRLPMPERMIVLLKFGFFGEALSREKICERLRISRSRYEKGLANAYDILYLTLSEFRDAG
ncbi:MAG TPA: hypothetical protein DCL38_07590, partial [Lachnospiraceae bacterium]|nr:hypothetical protein [Lachnospiraceae bacterium]